MIALLWSFAGEVSRLEDPATTEVSVPDANFSESLSRTDALYFSVTVISTVGFGDITAKAEGARLVVTAQMFVDLILVGLGLRLLLGATHLGEERHAVVPQGPAAQGNTSVEGSDP